MKYEDYYVTIGLEIHVALKTKYKLFSGSENNFEINDFSLFDIGMPGVLPVVSKEPVEMASAFALSVGADLRKYSEFDRKHYFYPDLPLGYQITQQHKPILIGGRVPIKIENQEKLIQIEHAHLECDAAKSIHDLYGDYTAIDISRCASPLLEIVSTPCMHSPEEAKEYAKAVHSLVTFLDICDGKMEEGSFRVDASISLCKEEGKLGTRVEIKNISSFGFLQSALEYEMQRQSEILNKNGKILMETRLYDEVSNTTKSMREKETVDEYRYMPDPDIIPLVLDDSFIENVVSKYFMNYFDLKKYLKKQLTKNNLVLDDGLFQQVLFQFKKLLIVSYNNKLDLSEKYLRLICYWIPEVLSKIETSKEINIDTINILEKSPLQAKEIKETLSKWLLDDKPIQEFMPSFIDNSEVEVIIQNILKQYPEQITKYKNGEIKLIQFLIGKCMAELKGKCQSTTVKELVEKIIKEKY